MTGSGVGARAKVPEVTTYLEPGAAVRRVVEVSDVDGPDCDADDRDDLREKTWNITSYKHYVTTKLRHLSVTSNQVLRHFQQLRHIFI